MRSSEPSRMAARRMSLQVSRSHRAPAQTPRHNDRPRTGFRESQSPAGSGPGVRPGHGRAGRRHPAQHQIAVRMHVVLVRNRLDAVDPLRPEQQVVRDGAAERGDAVPAEIGQRCGSVRCRSTDAQYFTELVIRNRECECGAPCHRVSTPLSPTSAAPRAMDWSSELT